MISSILANVEEKLSKFQSKSKALYMGFTLEGFDFDWHFNFNFEKLPIFNLN
ncbi:MAG: hypothetical protein ACJATF_003877 [Flavobacteriales bacterium]